MIRHILFDLDGTLTDSREGITRCMAYALAAMGHPCEDPKALVRFIGVPLGRCLGTLLQTADQATIRRAIALYRERFASRGMFENRVYAGIPEALAALRADGLQLWIVTAKPRVLAERIAAHFGLAAHVQGVFGPPLDGERMDKPGIIGEFLASSGLPPAETAMVGDRAEDIRGARQNRMRGVGVLWGYGTREELDAARPDLLLESPEELPALPRRLGSAAP
ncbi:MAG: HAD family hydrolase [Candidatus Methylomirabilales bacterium]